jgi:serine/threonine-protein kinase
MSPPALDHVVHRCLAKAPDERWQTASDLMRELKWIAEDGSDAIESASAGATSASLWKWALVASLVGGLVIGLIIWSLMRSETTPPPGVKRLTVRLPPTDQLILVAATGSVGISPDGSHIVYWARHDGNPQLLLRPMDELEATPVQGAKRAYHPFFSPDGKWMGFFDISDDRKLKKVPLTGGPPVLICDVETRPLGATWGANDTIFFATRRSGLWSVPGEGGSPQPITTLGSEGEEKDYGWPHILPDGKTLLVTEERSESEGGHRIVAINVETDHVRTLLEQGTDARYASSGHLLFQRGGSLVAVAFDLDSMEILGPPVLVLDKVRINSSSRADYTISRDGSLVYVSGDEFPPSDLVWVDRDGHSRRVAEGRRFYCPRLSPNGNRVLVSIREEGSVSNTWLYDLARDTLTRVTFEGRQDVGENTPAIWNPDGDKVTFGSIREGLERHLYSMAADGGGQAEQLTPNSGYQSADSWSPNGKVLAYTQSSENIGGDIGLVSLEGEPELRPFLQTPFWESQAKFSPDGAWIAYTSDESGRPEVYVRPYPGPGEKIQISNNGGSEPVWARDGKELFYRNGNRMMVVRVELGPTFTAGQPSLVFEGAYEAPAGGAIWTNYDVSPDGKAFLMIERTTEPPRDIHVVLNWFEELKRLVPTEK